MILLELLMHFIFICKVYFDEVKNFECQWSEPGWSISRGPFNNYVITSDSIVLVSILNSIFNYEPNLLNHLDLQYRLFRVSTPRLF